MGKSGLFDLTGQQPILVPKSSSYWILPEQFLGLEIEIEDYKSSQVSKLLRTSGNWTSVEDHSLRKGIELVFSQALMGQQLSEAIDEFYDSVTSYSNGPRTSIHVHVNMRQEEDTPLSLRNLCVLYYMYEDAFFAIADENRKWCSYCNPFEDSPPEVLTAVIRGDSMKEIRTQISIASEGRTNRYYGLNLLALGRHGTVEFRHLPCTKDRERVIEWIQLIMELKLAATEMATKGIGPFELFTDVNLLASLSQYMPRFGGRLRDLVPDVVAYRKLGLASMYRSGEQRRAVGGGIYDNVTFNRYLEKIFGSEFAKQKQSKKDFPYDSMEDLANEIRQQAPIGNIRAGRARAAPRLEVQVAATESLGRGLDRETNQLIGRMNGEELTILRRLMSEGRNIHDAARAVANQTATVQAPNEDAPLWVTTTRTFTGNTDNS